MNWIASYLIGLLSLDLMISIFLVYVMFKKYIETKIRAVAILLIFFIVDLSISFYEIPLIFFNSNKLETLYLDVSTLPPIIFSAIGILGAGIFLIFIDYYESETVPSSHIAVLSAIFFSFITFNWLKLLNLNNSGEFFAPVLPNTPISYDFLPPIMITYMLIISYPKLFRLLKEAELTKKRRSILGLIIALFFLFVIPSIFITLANFLPFGNQTSLILNTVVPRTSVLIGNLFLLGAYATASPAYLHSQRIEKLLVITKHGTPIYSLDFIENPTQKDDVLISGSLSALSSLLAESIQVTDLEVIQFLEKEVLIEHQSSVGFFLITDRPSQFVWNALKSSAAEISSKFDINQTSRSMTEMMIDSSLDSRVRSIFGLI